MNLTPVISVRRVTKRYLILEALAKAGYVVEPKDLEEDGRRRR